MFLDIDKKPAGKVAVIDDNNVSVTYGDLCAFSAEFARCFTKRSFIFILSENKLGSLLGFVASLSNNIVPLVISANTEHGLFSVLFDKFKPEFLWVPDGMVKGLGYNVIFSSYGFSLVETGLPTVKLNDKLAFLLPTSGSTGSPKLIRHSYKNIEANSENVKNLFNITPDEKAMAILPMHYTMGLSVITSHLKAGATVLLSGLSLLDRLFWTRLKEATSFTGVPYSYELLMKMRFTRMQLPNLKIITQGGGKLSPELFHSLAQYAQDNGKQFIATYGQSECTARMAYLPAHLAMEKTCSIGVAEPGGILSIVDDKGNETFEGEATGEMIFRGDNVTMGYAGCLDDLEKDDENQGVIHTGDVACRDKDGCYYIVGRLKRFLKIFGLRIGLDEIENMIKSEYAVDCYCKGDDEKLVVIVTDPSIAEDIPAFIESKTHLFRKCIETQVVEKIQRNEAGKIILQ